MARKRTAKRRPRKSAQRSIREWTAVDPPLVDANPWNHVIVVTRGVTLKPGEWVLTSMKSVALALKAQLGLTGLTENLSLRFLRTTVWGLPMFGKESPVATNLGVAYYQLLAPGYGEHDVRKMDEDVGTPVRPAYSTHRYSSAERLVIFESSSEHYLLGVEAQDAGLPILYHIDLLWRSVAGDPVPSLVLGSRPPPQRPRALGTTTAPVNNGPEGTESVSTTQDLGYVVVDA